MPDTLTFNESPARPPVLIGGAQRLPFDTSNTLARLYRETQAAETALEGSNEEPDGPLGQSYGAALDRFIEAPVDNMGDVLLKLEQIAYHEDLEAKPRLIMNRILINLLRDLRATDDALHLLSSIEAARQPGKVL